MIFGKCRQHISSPISVANIDVTPEDIIYTPLGIPALSQAMSGQHGINDENSRTYVEYGPAYGKDIGTGTMFYQRVRSPATRRKTFGGFGAALSDHYSNGLGLDDLSFSNWLV